LKTREGALDNNKIGFSGIFVSLLAMEYATKENQDSTKCWTYMDLWIETRMNIWIIGDLQPGMFLTYLEEKLVA
jgi:hypothetical protein